MKISSEEFDKRIDEVNEEMLSEPTEAVQSDEIVETEIPTDYYQKGLTERSVDAKTHTFPRGSSQKVVALAKSIAGDLSRAYERAKDDSDLLERKGDRQRAEWRRQQYLEEDFLPAVEAVIAYNSADELLNSKEAMAILDKYANVGALSGDGFTKAFVHMMHSNDRGQFSGTSDAYVRDNIGRIYKLLDADQIRSAISLAKRIQRQIDEGSHIASEDDYELIAKVTSRG